MVSCLTDRNGQRSFFVLSYFSEYVQCTMKIVMCNLFCTFYLEAIITMG